jgi:hypothetical protein
MTTPLVTDKAPQPVSPACDTSRSAEWQAVLKCASPCASSERLAVLSLHSLRWPELLQLAEHHCVTPLLAARAKDLDSSQASQEVRAELAQLQRSHAIAALHLTAELFRLLPSFAESCVEILITKGPALSVRCYRDPGMRQYGDIDLIVRERDIRRVTQAMLSLGYQPGVPLAAIDAKKTPGEYVFRKPGTGLLIEFHTERTFRYHPRPVPIEKLFQRHAALAIDGRDVPVLSLEDELVLICIHGAKHFWERLMWMADVAALISRQTLDWDRAIAAAREVDAERMLRLGLRLACDVLGAALPAQVHASVQSDRAVAKLAAQIETRLGAHQPHDMGVLQRALFRIRMPGNFIQGAAYLVRLSLSPTEEDWVAEGKANRPAFVEAIRRPFRLAKKHSRRSSE